MKHTPFPWLIDPYEPRQVRGGDWQAVAWCGCYPDEEAHANARLIAAAPELLDALQWVVACVPFADPSRAAALAAIAKATGESA